MPPWPSRTTPRRTRQSEEVSPRQVCLSFGLLGDMYATVQSARARTGQLSALSKQSPRTATPAANADLTLIGRHVGESEIQNLGGPLLGWKDNGRGT